MNAPETPNTEVKEYSLYSNVATNDTELNVIVQSQGQWNYLMDQMGNAFMMNPTNEISFRSYTAEQGVYNDYRL